MNVTSPTERYNLMDYAMEAARKTGVRLYNLRESGKGIAFTLKTGEKDEYRFDWRGKLKWQARYQRLSTRETQSTAKDTDGVAYNPVVPGAVCWHGHRDFLRAFYGLVPDAKIRTAFITYQNAEHFEDNYQRTWNGNPDAKYDNFAFVGSIRPYRDACTCDEGGI